MEERTDRRSEESHPHEDTLDTKVTQHKATGSEAGSVKGKQSRRKQSIASTRISNTSNLDNVSLDDDTPPSPGMHILFAFITAHNTDLCSAKRSSTETKQQDDISEQHLSSVYAVVARR